MMKLKLTIIVLITLTLGACSSPKEKSFFDKLDLKDMQGKSITTSDLDGKMAFINLWATSCKPCLKEMPSIERAMKILKDENYVFIAVSDEDKDRIQNFIKKYDYTFEFAQYELGINGLDVYALPASYIVNSKGDVLYRHIGEKEWDSDDNIALFRSYIKN